MHKRFYLLLIICLSFVGLRAQHYQFSQFYAAQTYLNPAFTGANVCSRLSINYRDQWSTIPGTFTTYQLALDHYIRKANSGIGLMFFSDKAGSGNLKSTQFSLLYAYELKINKKFAARAGFNVGGIQRSIDYNSLVFGDQIARGGASSSVEDLSMIRKIYFDAGFGMLFYTMKSWAGFSLNHLNRPDQSLLNEDESKLPGELKIHGGHKFTLEGDETTTNAKKPEKNSITVTFNYKKQRKFNQLDVGLYFSRKFFVLGAWYRGIPIHKPTTYYRSNDALVFLFGVSVDKFNIGYSYDATISKLTNVSTGGSHEISLSYEFCNPKKKKKRAILISCPKF
jgi:type IX secretion system PorP/SprF family membrane protein